VSPLSVNDFLAGSADRFDVTADALHRVAGGKRGQEHGSKDESDGLTHG
jgi:hypothetical protein